MFSFTSLPAPAVESGSTLSTTHTVSLSISVQTTPHFSHLPNCQSKTWPTVLPLYLQDQQHLGRETCSFTLIRNGPPALSDSAEYEDIQKARLKLLSAINALQNLLTGPDNYFVWSGLSVSSSANQLPSLLKSSRLCVSSLNPDQVRHLHSPLHQQVQHLGCSPARIHHTLHRAYYETTARRSPRPSRPPRCNDNLHILRTSAWPCRPMP